MNSRITVVGKAAVDSLPEVKKVLNHLAEHVVEDEGEYMFLPLNQFEDIFNRLLKLYNIRYFHVVSA